MVTNGGLRMWKTISKCYPYSKQICSLITLKKNETTTTEPESALMQPLHNSNCHDNTLKFSIKQHHSIEQVNDIQRTTFI